MGTSKRYQLCRVQVRTDAQSSEVLVLPLDHGHPVADTILPGRVPRRLVDAQAHTKPFLPQMLHVLFPACWMW